MGYDLMITGVRKAEVALELPNIRVALQKMMKNVIFTDLYFGIKKLTK